MKSCHIEKATIVWIHTHTVRTGRHSYYPMRRTNGSELCVNVCRLFWLPLANLIYGRIIHVCVCWRAKYIVEYIYSDVEFFLHINARSGAYNFANTQRTHMRAINVNRSMFSREHYDKYMRYEHIQCKHTNVLYKQPVCAKIMWIALWNNGNNEWWLLNSAHASRFCDDAKYPQDLCMDDVVWHLHNKA